VPVQSRNGADDFSPFLPLSRVQTKWVEVRSIPCEREAVADVVRFQSSETSVNPEESSGLTPTTVSPPPSSVLSTSLSAMATFEVSSRTSFTTPDG
jgi:hypothetical protein